jgi:hypothetical protein
MRYAECRAVVVATASAPPEAWPIGVGNGRFGDHCSGAIIWAETEWDCVRFDDTAGALAVGDPTTLQLLSLNDCHVVPRDR